MSENLTRIVLQNLRYLDPMSYETIGCMPSVPESTGLHVGIFYTGTCFGPPFAAYGLGKICNTLILIDKNNVARCVLYMNP